MISWLGSITREDKTSGGANSSLHINRLVLTYWNCYALINTSLSVEVLNPVINWLPQLIHLQWFYDLVEEPPGSPKVYITYTGSHGIASASVPLLKHKALCAVFALLGPPGHHRATVPRATVAVADGVSQYSGADKKPFCIQPAYLFPLLTTNQRFCSPQHWGVQGEGKAGMDEVHLSDLSGMYKWMTM